MKFLIAGEPQFPDHYLGLAFDSVKQAGKLIEEAELARERGDASVMAAAIATVASTSFAACVQSIYSAVLEAGAENGMDTRSSLEWGVLMRFKQVLERNEKLEVAKRDALMGYVDKLIDERKRWGKDLVVDEHYVRNFLVSARGCVMTMLRAYARGDFNNEVVEPAVKAVQAEQVN